MTTQMVRKQIYIRKRQEAMLKRLAKARGISEAEIIRQAIEHELGSAPTQPPVDSHTAWQELLAFLDARWQTTPVGESYRWSRPEIYTERESHWIRDQDDE